VAMGETPSWFVVSRAASPLEWALEMRASGLTREMAVASFISTACTNAVLSLCWTKIAHCSFGSLTRNFLWWIFCSCKVL